MPHYDYRCTVCKSVHEENRRVSDIDHVSYCIICGAEAKYSFNPVNVQGYIAGGPTHKWDSSNPFLPKRYDADGRPKPFETYGALADYKKEHDLIDAFDIDADSSVKRYDDDTQAMAAYDSRISQQDRQLAEYDALPDNRKVVGNPTIVNVDDSLLSE